eukprot:TRINITY_DN12077_c0_g2_i1.p1 TRINITY_DN12077_c0_g2~~TRINITY_DN12077_c0_g2_i1.p1  ORF type:complete len:564 (-),score=131.31 TRINITY_DN12077_c0_g2_i1:179-1870(-)
MPGADEAVAASAAVAAPSKATSSKSLLTVPSRQSYDYVLREEEGSTGCDGHASASSRSRIQTRLLAGLSEESMSVAQMSALVINMDGSEGNLEKARLPDLARKVRSRSTIPVDESTTFQGLCQDMRFICDRSKQDFVLQPSKSGYLVRSDFIRALVEPQRVVFIKCLSEGFEAFLQDFREELLARINHGSFNPPGGVPPGSRPEASESPTFDFWVVECIVCATVAMHTLRWQVLKPVLHRSLGSLRVEESQEKIMQLYPLKVALLKFVEQLRPLVACLTQYSHTEADNCNGLQAGNVSMTASRRFTPKMLERFELQQDLDNHCQMSALEEMLDKWGHNAEEVMADAVEMNNIIEEATRFTEASLSYTRNELLKLELLATAISLSLAWGALIAGVWGMNFDTVTPIFQVEGGFWMATLSILLMGVASFLCARGCFKRSQTKYEASAVRFGNNRFFGSIGDDGYVLSLGASLEDGDCPQSVVDRLLEDLKEPAGPVARGDQPSSSFSRNRSGSRTPHQFTAATTPHRSPPSSPRIRDPSQRYTTKSPVRSPLASPRQPRLSGQQQ